MAARAATIGLGVKAFLHFLQNSGDAPPWRGGSRGVAAQSIMLRRRNNGFGQISPCYLHERQEERSQRLPRPRWQPYHLQEFIGGDGVGYGHQKTSQDIHNLI
jgi:hypothetical protein